MNVLVVGLLLFAIAIAQLLIGGTRLLYSIPACSVLALAGLTAALWPRKIEFNARLSCLLSALAFGFYLLGRDWLSPVDYLARPDFIILAGSLIVYLTVALFLPRARWRLFVFWGLLLFG
ncbi:MAG: hypothetical protein QOD99_2716, partial [Chthoniobacter sp.]|nr:hypothetical protein [Chthoniobacter sp.]